MEYLKEMTKEELIDRKVSLENQALNISSLKNVTKSETDLLDELIEEIDAINDLLK